MSTPACDFFPGLTVALDKLPPLKGTRKGNGRRGDRKDVNEPVCRQRRRHTDEPGKE